MEEQKKVDCCFKWKYQQINTIVQEENGYAKKIVIMHTEEAKDTDILFCPECGKKLELYWVEAEKEKTNA